MSEQRRRRTLKRPREMPDPWEDRAQHTKNLLPEWRRLGAAQARSAWLAAKVPEDLQKVEELYRAAISAFDRERMARGGAANKFSDDEHDARQKLILLLIQSGRAEAASGGLETLGFKCRLSRDVLDYSYAGGTGGTGTVPRAPAFDIIDHALPTAVWAALSRALSPVDASYWTAHNYQVEPPSPYFSYVIPISDAVSDPSRLGSLGVLLRCVLRAAAATFGEERLNRIRFAEIWAHNRPHACGHQLHYDSDDEGRGGVRSPMITSVMFVQGKSGGPTLLTNQYLGDTSLGTTGWLCEPRDNRLLE